MPGDAPSFSTKIAVSISFLFPHDSIPSSAAPIRFRGNLSNRRITSIETQRCVGGLALFAPRFAPRFAKVCRLRSTRGRKMRGNHEHMSLLFDAIVLVKRVIEISAVHRSATLPRSCYVPAYAPS